MERGAPPASGRSRLACLTVAILATLALAEPASATTPSGPAARLRDIARRKVTERFTSPGRLVVFKGRLYYAGSDRQNGLELWSSDGTAEGRTLLQDINPGVEDGVPVGMMPLGDRMVFTAFSGTARHGLWSTDGTAAGTTLIQPFPEDLAAPALLVLTLTGTALYAVRTNAGACTVWSTDGTAGGTLAIGEMCVTEPGVSLGGGGFFAASLQGSDAAALWWTNGRAAVTLGVRNTEPSAPTRLGGLTVAGDAVFFAAYREDVGAELWRSDGSNEGMALVRDLLPGTPGSNPRSLVAAGRTLYFFASTVEGVGLWRSNGTSQGTTLVARLPGTPLGAVAAGDRVVYAVTGQERTISLWVSDGTADGTSRLGVSERGWDSPSFTPLTVTGGVAWFLLCGTTDHCTMWRTDGTEDGTTRLAAIAGSLQGPAYPAILYEGGLFFTTRSEGGSHLWRSDGTPSGTVTIRPAPGPASSQGVLPNNAAVGDVLFFAASDGELGMELWKSDGTERGTVIVEDIFPGPESSNPQDLTPVGNRLFFTAFTAPDRPELCKSDATGTTPVRNPRLPAQAPSAWELVDAGGGLTFMMHLKSGAELWRTDGRATGTTRLKEQHDAGGARSCLTAANGMAYFREYDPVLRYRLWGSNGSVAGTGPIANLDPTLFTNPRYETRCAAVGGALYFDVRTTLDSTTGLWRSDGTRDGTFPLAPVSPSYLFNAAGTLYFSASDDEHGTELWTTDGTAEGTRLVADIADGVLDGIHPGERRDRMATLDGVLYFAADDREHGLELWRSDGTPDGTSMVSDIRPGPAGSWPQFLVSAQGRLYFAASDGPSGLELWRSDGTREGTVRVQDIAAGAASSSPRSLTVAGRRLFFHADDTATGVELWAGRLSVLAGQPGLALDELRAEITKQVHLPKAVATRLIERVDQASRTLEGGDIPETLMALRMLIEELDAPGTQPFPSDPRADWTAFARAILSLLEPAERGGRSAR